MNFKRGTPWHQLLFVKEETVVKSPKHEVYKYMDRAHKLYNQYIETLSTDEITQQIVEGGTLADKFTAFKVAATETPLSSLKNLETILEFLEKKPRIALEAVNAGVEMFSEGLLPDSRPLRKFEDQPLKGANESHLVLFYFEDKLKTIYAKFITKLESMVRSAQQFVRDPVIKAFGTLLKAAPENERVILMILVDKFGDPLSAIANTATSTILSVLKEHPQMNGAVVAAIKSRMDSFVPNSKKRAMKFLGQLSIGSEDKEAASSLLEQVRGELLEVLSSNDASNNKVMSRLMHAAERCAAVCDSRDLESLIQPLQIYVGGAPLATAIPALRLLFAIHKASHDIPVAFYRFFYKLLADPDFGSSSKHPEILNLLLQALEIEDNNQIICSFVHRVLHIGMHQTVAFSAAALVFVRKLLVSKPSIRSIFDSVEPSREKCYDFSLETPENENAPFAFPWILSLYATHYHPAVRALAESIVRGKELVYEADPFQEFSLKSLVARLDSKGHVDTEASELFRASYQKYDEIPDYVPFEPKEEEVSEEE